MTRELKPCPFCGGEAEIHHVPDMFSPRRNVYWGQCCSCRMSGKHHRTRQKAIVAWNTRAVEVCEIVGFADAEPLPIIPERTCIAEENIGASYGDCMFVCSECGADFDNEEFPRYCPQCGARVVEKGDGE